VQYKFDETSHAKRTRRVRSSADGEIPADENCRDISGSPLALPCPELVVKLMPSSGGSGIRMPPAVARKSTPAPSSAAPGGASELLLAVISASSDAGPIATASSDDKSCEDLLRTEWHVELRWFGEGGLLEASRVTLMVKVGGVEESVGVEK